jgi:hypothetical protein
MEKRLLNNDDVQLANCARVLYRDNLPQDVSNHLTFGENEINDLAMRLKINERDMIRGFRTYLVENKFPEELLVLKYVLSTFPISSSECERGFSQINLIVTPTRASLSTKTVSNLLSIRIVGPPLRHFLPVKYVDSWFLRGHHSAVHTKSKTRNTDISYDENL